MSEILVEQISAETYAAKIIDFIIQTKGMSMAETTSDNVTCNRLLKQYSIMDSLQGIAPETIDGMIVMQFNIMLTGFDGNRFTIVRLCEEKIMKILCNEYIFLHSICSVFFCQDKNMQSLDCSEDKPAYGITFMFGVRER
jgi:hypothetical protein